MNIKTVHNPPPIPTRDCDWQAWDDDTYDAEYVDGRWRASPMGFGRTEAEAIADLEEKLDLCPCCHAGPDVDCDCMEREFAGLLESQQ